MINLKKITACIMVLYILFSISFHYIAGEQLYIKTNVTTAVAPESLIGELLAGDIIEQNFILTEGILKGVKIKFATYGRQNIGTVKVAIYQGNQIFHEETIDNTSFVDGDFYYIDLPINQLPEGTQLCIKVESLDGIPGNAMTLWKGSGVSTGRFEIKQELSEKERLYFNGELIEGKLCFEVKTQQNLWFGKYYWNVIGVFGILLLLWCLYTINKQKKGEKTIALTTIAAFKKYSFLMKQLIARDFKTKYKRSVLGVLWSFLNPLLTMFVQYAVFSTLFKSSIPNFAAYLLTGIVCFGFFSEAVNGSLMSIVGNASLITKVYVPKYIYPFSKICSSVVNLLFSLLPLLLVLTITKASISKSILLAPFGIICLIIFATGVGLVLASAMVFFRDIQFLWGVVSLLWMYCTPIFYPESIIPEKFMTIYKMNPLYHFLRFIRITLIEGVSPEPRAYLMCIIASFVPLLIGLLVFWRTQDRFVLKI